ncbi:hypothetical protein [Mycoplasma sp. SG1]|uniref:hypothetical protein n=1 Tax=Mycoplasma sp. SG1 TaxID=2810348 RepID=UPI002024F7CB|nr:hypothetical protein [Mycoplasma sp. SG1]URM53109.1 hypothetical protein JRW51_02045 [Mycoplasma sp. SG1]
MERQGTFLSFIVFLGEEFSDFKTLKVCFKSLLSACFLKHKINIVVFSFLQDPKKLQNFLIQEFVAKQRKKICCWAIDQNTVQKNKILELIVKKISIHNPVYLKIIDPLDWLQINGITQYISTLSAVDSDVFFHNYVRVNDLSYKKITLNDCFSSTVQVFDTFPKVPANLICWETMIFKFSIFKDKWRELLWLDNNFLNYQLSLFVFLLSKKFFFIDKVFVYHIPQKRLIKPNSKMINFFSIFIYFLLKTNFISFNIEQKIVFANYLKEFFLIFLKNLQSLKKSFKSKKELINYNKYLIKQIKLLDKIVYKKFYKSLTIKIFILTSGKVNLKRFF